MVFSCNWRITVLLALAVPLGACVSHNYVAGPNVAPEDYSQDRAACNLFARGANPEYEFSAFGSPKFVAGAMLGQAIGAGIASAIRTSANFDDCMQLRGWVVADGAAQPTLQAAASPGSNVTHNDQVRRPAVASKYSTAMTSTHLAALPFLPTDNAGSNLGRLTYAAVDQLLARTSSLNPADAVKVSLSRTSGRGRPSEFDSTVADLVRDRLVQRGVPVFEASSDGALTEVVVKATPKEKDIYISLRLVSDVDHRILSAVDYVFFKDPVAAFELSRLDTF